MLYLYLKSYCFESWVRKYTYIRVIACIRIPYHVVWLETDIYIEVHVLAHRNHSDQWNPSNQLGVLSRLLWSQIYVGRFIPSTTASYGQCVVGVVTLKAVCNSIREWKCTTKDTLFSCHDWIGYAHSISAKKELLRQEIEKGPGAALGWGIWLRSWEPSNIHAAPWQTLFCSALWVDTEM